MTESHSAQTPVPAMQALSAITQTPQLVEYFHGIFHTMGIIVAETGETLTATHSGTAITFSPGMEPNVDYRVRLRQENVTRLIAHAQGGRIDAQESWRIVSVLFTPLTESMLQKPIFSSNWLRWLAGVEAVTHVYLLNPSGDEPATHTLIFAGSQWLVLPGLHGRPQRTYQITPNQALEFQRRVFRAVKAKSWTGWWQFATWYRHWRRLVSSARP